MKRLRSNIGHHSLFFVFFFLFSISCSEENDENESKGDGFQCDTVLTNFTLKQNDVTFFKPFLITDSTIHIKVNRGCDLSTIIPLFSISKGNQVYCDSIEIISGQTSLDLSDFTKPITLKIETSLGTIKNWHIILYDIPIMVIATPDGRPITSKKVRTEGCTVKLVEDGDNIDDLGTAGIKGRGNSSWLKPKKPYNIKLDEKKPILGMKKSKHWVLLSNAYFDRTQLHNATAFEMARLTDYPWVQSGRFVELIFNGVHQGLYYLCEKIRIEKGKIDITEISPTDLEGENLTGGYLLESEVGAEDLNHDLFVCTDYFYKTGRGFNYFFGWRPQHPEIDEIPSEQFSYLKESMNHMEMLIMNEDSLLAGTYREYFDIESAINWWLVQEATLNEEATRTKNVYLYKDRGGAICCGTTMGF